MKRWVVGAVGALVFLWAGAAVADGDSLPGFIVKNSVQVKHYDGVGDDLLSAGLNQEGLIGDAPAVSDPPTAAELRRLAIYGNYRGIIDPVPGGGIGVFWGPKSLDAPTFPAPVVEGLIPGVEYLAYAKVKGPRGIVNNITIAVQIPDNFDHEKRCIITAPPSGSRGVYGGIAVGEWGLFMGCAVAYGGKGTGTGFHDLGSETVYDINGNAVDADAIGKNAQFRVEDSRRLEAFKAHFPDRVATKHAHSRIHPETLWGRFVLNSIEFAFWALNDHFGVGGHDDDDDDDDDDGDDGLRRFDKHSTIVIASGVSNGAGASLRALEDDEKGLIDGLVVTEPNINPRSRGRFDIKFGDDVFSDHGATLYDDITVMGTYAGCAVKNATLDGTPFFGFEPFGAPPGATENRCTSLETQGLVSGGNVAAQSASAIQALRDIGYYEEMDWGIAFHEILNLWRSLQPTYAASYGRFAVWDNICDVSFASTTGAGAPMRVPDLTLASLFATSSGTPATSGINLIADNSLDGPILEVQAKSSTGAQDLNLEGALCFRYLSTGDKTLLGDTFNKRDLLNRFRVAKGSVEVRTTGNLRGKPAIIAYGRGDALVFPNSHSRAYYGLNQVVEGEDSGLRIWEVTPGQHFDTFLSNFIVDPATGETLFVPLHFYLTEGLRMMLEHLTAGDPLPPSQVVRSEARGLTPYTAADFDTRLELPDADPGGDAITYDAEDKVLFIPRGPS